jgi:hypothetical protein
MKEKETALPPCEQASTQLALVWLKLWLQLVTQPSTAVAVAFMRPSDPNVCDGATVVGHSGMEAAIAPSVREAHVSRIMIASPAARAWPGMSKRQVWPATHVRAIASPLTQ